MIAKRKKRVLQKTITVHLRFLYFYHLCFLRGTRTGNSVLSHSSLKLDTAIGKPCGMRRDAQANQIKFKRKLRRQVQVQSCKSDWTALVLSQNGLCKMLTDNVYVLDETSDAKPAPIIHLDASHRKPKDYHDFFFTGFSKAVKTKSGVQGRHERKARCKLCITSNSPNGKQVKATDSYANLTQNYAA